MKIQLQKYYQKEFSKIGMYNSEIRLGINDYFQDLNLDDTENQKYLFNLLEQNNTSFRYLIEGNIGVGKTVLMKYIAYLWSTEQILKNFNLVLYIDLSRLKEKAINSKDIILSNYQPIFDSIENLSALKVLYLCDGMDFTEFNARLKELENNEERFALYAFLNYIFQIYYPKEKVRERERVYENFEKELELISDLDKKIDLIYEVGIKISKKTFHQIKLSYNEKSEDDVFFKVAKEKLMEEIELSLVEEKS